MKRSLSFGSVAEDYERYRGGYPTQLFELIMDNAGVPRESFGEFGTAIEVGAGTGKATRVIAGAGLQVTATEPDPAMLAVLERECAGLPVSAICAALEDPVLDQLEPVDLLYAAAALHWTEPAGRWDRVAGLVRVGGVVAFFGGPTESDSELAAIEHRVLAAHGIEVGPAGPVSPGTMAWPGDELQADDRFAHVRQRSLPRRVSYSRADYLGLLNTISAYRTLEEPVRDAVLADLEAELPEVVDLAADITMHTARRV